MNFSIDKKKILCYYIKVNQMKNKFKERMRITMSVFKKILLVAISLICISFSMCFAIDENQLTQNNSNSVVATPNQSATDNTNTSTNIIDNTTTPNDSMQNIPSIVGTTESTENTSTTSTREQASTTVSSVSSGSNNSTITNILNIALIVVGVLLILFAIAIIIRLH